LLWKISYTYTNENPYCEACNAETMPVQLIQHEAYTAEVMPVQLKPVLSNTIQRHDMAHMDGKL